MNSTIPIMLQTVNISRNLYFVGRNAYTYRSKDGDLLEYDVDSDVITILMSNSTFVRETMNTSLTNYYINAPAASLLVSYTLYITCDENVKVNFDQAQV